MTKQIQATLLAAAFLSAALTTSVAQTTATWTGAASDGLWNTAGNWDIGVPAETTNAIIGQTTVNYNTAMAATSFAGLTLGGALNVNADGFTMDAATAVPLTIDTNGFLTINSAGVVVITNSGSVTMLTPTTGASPVLDVEGGSLILSNNFGTFNFGESANKDNNIGAVFTNNGGNIQIDQQLVVKGRDTRFYMSGGTMDLQGGLNLNVVNNDMRQFFTIAGGTANLGDINIARATTAGGVSVEGGVVNSSSIDIGSSIAAGNSRMTGGIWTNAGVFYIADRNNAATSSNRRVYFTMDDGYLVTLGTDGIVINNQGEASTSNLSNNGGTLNVNGGTITAEGIYLNGPSVTANSYARFGLSGGTVYLGTIGLVANADAGNSLTAVFTLTGGTLAAKDDWTSAADLPLGGTVTFQAADEAATAHNITLDGVLSGGSGSLVKTGAGTLTLNGLNSYSGTTTISEGALTLGAAATLASSSINVGSGATFDVSAVSGFSLGSGQAITGSGVVAGTVNIGSAAIVNPGSNAVTGTLTFTNNLVETGGAVNHFDLPNGPLSADNDTVAVANLSVSGLNTVEVNGAFTAGAYPLFQYGSFTGDVSSFDVSGVTGVLSNSVANSAIYLVVTESVRSPTNVVWVGNAVDNNWDVVTTTNWLNDGALDFFVSGDDVLFDATGQANPMVAIVENVTPGSVTVDATGNYTFTGNGMIAGLGGLTKTNSGTLTVLTTNTYTGATAINGGVLEVFQLDNGGVASGIGAATADAANLVINNGTFRYSGANVTIDRSATLNNPSSAIDVSITGSLTLNGLLTGSGALTKTGDGTLVLNNSGNDYSGGTIVQAGTLTVNSATAISSGGVDLTGGTLAIGAVKPANSINVSAPSMIMGGNGGGLTGVKNVTGSGDLVLAVTTGVFDLTGDMTAYGGTITFSNAGGSIVRLNGATGSALATWDLGIGTMDLNVRTSSSVNNFGALKGAVGTTLSGRGGSGNNGPTTHVIGANGLDTTFEGVIQNGSGTGSSTAITKVGTGTLTLAGYNTYTGNTTISNGVLALAYSPNTGDGSIDSSAAINIVSGATLDVSGRTDQALQLGYSQILQGRGTLQGALNVSGTVAPGDGLSGDTGTLTVTNTVNLYGTAWMKLNRNNTPNSDRLVSSLSSIFYGGTLVITNVGAPLQAGDTFTLFSGSALDSGAFGSIVLPGYYTWDTSQLTVNGSVSVTAVLPPPSITNADFSTLSSGYITLSAINGVPYGPVSVLSSTNLALPLSQWTVVDTSTFDDSGNYFPIVTVDPAAPQSYFLLQAQ